MAGGLLVVFFLLSVQAFSKADLCSTAIATCAKDVNCQSLFLDLSTTCGQSISKGQECSQECRNAYSALTANSVGRDFVGCDCENSCPIPACVGNGDNRQPSTSAPAVVTQAPGTTSCTALLARCVQDTTCARLGRALTGTSCGTIMNGNCSDACKTDFTNLIQNAIGRQFMDCTCDDMDQLCALRRQIAEKCYGGTLPSGAIGNVVSMVLTALTLSVMAFLLITL
jgi:hypothetical protein